MKLEERLRWKNQYFACTDLPQTLPQTNVGACFICNIALQLKKPTLSSLVVWTSLFLTRERLGSDEINSGTKMAGTSGAHICRLMEWHKFCFDVSVHALAKQRAVLVALKFCRWENFSVSMLRELAKKSDVMPIRCHTDGIKNIPVGKRKRHAPNCNLNMNVAVL